MAGNGLTPVGIVLQAAAQIFRHPAYAALAGGVAVAAFAAALWLPNLALIRAVFGAADVSWVARLQLLASLLAGIGTNFGTVVALATVAAVLLFGVDVAMLVYFVRRRGVMPGREAAAGLGAALTGAVAAGCAACGSLVVFALLSFAGAAGALALLPLGGGELSLLSVVLLVVSIYLIARRIVVAPVCDIPGHSQPRGST